MSYPIFNWVPAFGTRKSHAPKLYKAEFGDGYKQQARLGINNNPITYQLTFPARDWNQIAQIDQFVLGLGGADPFYWTTPTDGVRLFTCEGWDRGQLDVHVESAALTFTEFFTPEPLPSSIAIMLMAPVLI